MDPSPLLILALAAGQPPDEAEDPTADGRRRPPTAVPRRAIRTFSGEVREISGGPAGRSQAILLAGEGRRLTLHALRPAEASELIRLTGVRVRIRTARDPGLPGPDHVRVLSYEILDVGGGIRPRVGHIARLEHDGRPRLVFVDEFGRADWLPAGWAPKLERHVGSKVWMAGRRKGDVFLPTRFAILRSAPRKEISR